MRTTIFFLAFIISHTSLADDKPSSKTYKCQSTGCSVSCLSDRERWSTLATGASKVDMNHYANGNVEFVLKHDTNVTSPNEIILISQENLQCKLAGVVIEP